MRTLEIREPRREKVELENTTTTKNYRLGTVLLASDGSENPRRSQFQEPSKQRP